MRITVAFLISFLMLSLAHADDDINAPVGLAWGMSGKKLVTEYSAVETNASADLKLYKIVSPPIKIPDFDYLYGAVDEKYGLVRVVLVKELTNDTYGSDGLELYKKYKDILKEKYGKPDSFEYIGRKVYKEKDEFYQCLDYRGCGAYLSFFAPKAKTGLYMALKGYGRGEGSLHITYESSNLKKLEAEKNSETLEKASQGL
ncbi:hypothetical protein [Serratia fonticola]